MEYIRYIWQKNIWKIVVFTIILILLILGLKSYLEKNDSGIGKSFLVGEYSKKQDTEKDSSESYFSFDYFNKEKDIDGEHKSVVISELRNLNKERLTSTISILLVSTAFSVFIFFVIPILFRNIFVNKTNLQKDLEIPFLAYFNSHSSIDNKMEYKKEKIKEAKEEQLGELIAKIFANTLIKDKKTLLFISDDLRDDKIDILFELSNMLSNIEKKVLILDLPLEDSEEIIKVEKQEKKSIEKEQIKKLTTFCDMLICNNEEKREKEISFFTTIDKNVNYAKFTLPTESIEQILLKEDKILDDETKNNYDYILVNGVDKLDPERYLPLADKFLNTIILTKHFKTDVESLEKVKWDIANTEAKIAGIIIVKNEKYNN